MRQSSRTHFLREGALLARALHVQSCCSGLASWVGVVTSTAASHYFGATVAYRAHSHVCDARCADDEKEFPELPWRGSGQFAHAFVFVGQALRRSPRRLTTSGLSPRRWRLSG